MSEQPRLMACDARQPVSGSPLAPAQGLELSGGPSRQDKVDVLQGRIEGRRTEPPVVCARAGPEKSESVRDSRIGRIMIQHVGWKGGRHGWQNPIHRIYVSAWCWRFWEVNPGARRRAALRSVRAA